MQIPMDNYSVEDLVCNESFQQYCLGSSLAEQVKWEEWIQANPDRLDDFNYAKKIVKLLSLNQGSRIEQLKQLRAGMKQQAMLKESLLTPVEMYIPKPTSPRKTGIYTYIGGIAASIALVVGFYLLADTRIAGEPVFKAEKQAGYVFSSGTTPRKTVVLSDGTLITLAIESSIETGRSFNTGKREIWLKGEAFFDVKHDASRPFIVHTSFDEIRVLGTTFNVKAYPNAASMETSLIKGSVQVNSKQYEGYSVILKPNQKLISSKRSAVLSDEDPKRHFQVSALKVAQKTQLPTELNWVRSRLDIDNQPLSVIADRLQKWYGIEVVITDEAVKNYYYSGTFENETIIKTLEALQLSYPFTFHMEQERIVITK
jgi:transmembrane sensor